DGLSIMVYDLKAEREWIPDFRSKRGKAPNIHALALSPDGQQLAFIGCHKDEHSIQIAPAAGGETRELFTKVGVGSKAGLVWTPDGRYLLFGNWDKGAQLWRIPVEGGEPENLGLTMGRIEHLDVHPDGHRIAFTGPGLTRDPEVWVMENILPTSTANR
ncbi:TolB family protein, partial [Candidatus Poribacteria bacterium]